MLFLWFATAVLLPAWLLTLVTSFFFGKDVPFGIAVATILLIQLVIGMVFRRG